MEVDEALDTVPETMGQELAVVEYSKKNIGAMGRWLTRDRSVSYHVIRCYLLLFVIALIRIGLIDAFDQLLEASFEFPFFISSRDEVVNLLDNIAVRVETLRKDAIKLQEQRDQLLTRIDMLKNTEVLSNLNETDKEEISVELKRINDRLQVRVKRLSRRPFA